MQNLWLKMNFYRKGRLVGGSFATFRGKEEDLQKLTDEEGNPIEGLREFMAKLARARRYDFSTSEHGVTEGTEVYGAYDVDAFEIETAGNAEG